MLYPFGEMFGPLNRIVCIGHVCCSAKETSRSDIYIVLTIIRHRNGRDTVARHCYTRKSQPLFDLAALFTLDAVFVLTETGVAFQAKRVRSAITAQSTDVGNVFKLRGEFWQATFAGETQHFKDAVGMKYIARLLSEPHKDLATVTLQSLQSGIDPLVIRGRLSAGFARVCGAHAAPEVSLETSRTIPSIHTLCPSVPHFWLKLSPVSLSRTAWVIEGLRALNRSQPTRFWT